MTLPSPIKRPPRCIHCDGTHEHYCVPVTTGPAEKEAV